MICRKLLFFWLPLAATADVVEETTWPELLARVKATMEPGLAEAWLEGRDASTYQNCLASLKEDSRLPFGQEIGIINVLFVRWAAVDLKTSAAALGHDQWNEWRLQEAAGDGWARGAWGDTPTLLAALPSLAMSEPLKSAVLPKLAANLPGPSVQEAYQQLKALASATQNPQVLQEMVDGASSGIASLPRNMDEWQAARLFLSGLPASQFKASVQDLLWLNPPAGLATGELWNTAIDEQQPASVLGWVLARIFREDREQAWQNLDALQGPRRVAAEEAAVGSITPAVADSVPWFLEKQPLSQWSPKALAMMCRYYLEHSPGEAIGWMRANADLLPDEAWAFAGQFAVENLDFARMWLELRCETLEQASANGYAPAVRTVAKHAPDEAVAWVTSHLSGDLRDYELARLVGELAALQPEKALSIVPSIRNGDSLADARARLFEAWAPVDFQAALMAAESFPAEQRLWAICDVCAKGARTDPERAATAFVDLLQSASASEPARLPLTFAADDVARGLAQMRGQRLLDWMKVEVPPAHRQWMAVPVFYEMKTLLGSELDAFIHSMPADEVREAWLVQRAMHGFDNALLSLEFAAQIRDSATRTEVCRDLVDAWKNLDPVFARHTLPGVPLPAPELENLLSRLETP